MAREFDDSTSNYLANTTSSPLTAGPMTMCCWFNTDNRNNTSDMLMLTDKDDGSGVGGLGTNAGDWALAFGNPNVALEFHTGVTLSNDTWYFGACVYRSSTDRTLWVNTTTQDKTASRVFSGDEDCVVIGASDGGASISNPFDGEIAEAAIWNRALDAAEMTMLANRFSPLFLPRGLVFYAPLNDGTGNERDLAGGRTLTETGTVTLTPHPRIIYPGQVQLGVPAGDAPPAGGMASRLTLLGVGI